MVILTVMAVSVEVGRWLWFHGGRLPFHLLAAVAGVIVVFTTATLLQRVRQHEAAELAAEVNTLPDRGLSGTGSSDIFARSCRLALSLTL